MHSDQQLSGAFASEPLPMTGAGEEKSPADLLVQVQQC